MSASELAEIEKKVQEIEHGIISQDIDEDDAGKIFKKRKFSLSNLFSSRRQTSI
jgi:hypothetical protein